MPKNLTRGMMLLFVVFVIASLGFYGGAQLVETEETPDAGTEAGVDEGGVPGGPVTVRIVGKDQKFDRRSITASAGASVTATLDNQDAGVLHNLAFYTNRNATQAIAVGELFAGPGVREMSFTAPSTPGSYYFRCDVHPDTMTGSFVVR